MPRSRSGSKASSEDATSKGGDIKSEGFPQEYRWMAGRSVFRRPESRPSNVAKRDVIENQNEQDQVTRAYVASAIARRSVTAAQLDAEIDEFRQWENRERDQEDKGRDYSSD